MSFHCETLTDCNYKGYCLEGGECLCDIGWFGNACKQNLEQYSADGFAAYRITFIVLYGLIGLVNMVRIQRKITKERKIYGLDRMIIFWRGMRSPYNLTLRCVILICLSQTVWLAVDPFIYNGIFHRSLERVLYELSFTLLFIIYATVLWIWYSIYEAVRLRGNHHSMLRIRRFKPMMISFVIFAVPSQVVASVLKGFHVKEFRFVVLVIYLALFGIQMFFVLGYVVYGYSLYRHINKKQKAIRLQSLKSSAPSTPRNTHHHHGPARFHTYSFKEDSINMNLVHQSDATFRNPVALTNRALESSKTISENSSPLDIPKLRSIPSLPMEYGIPSLPIEYGTHTARSRLLNPTIPEESSPKKEGLESEIESEKSNISEDAESEELADHQANQSGDKIDFSPPLPPLKHYNTIAPFVGLEAPKLQFRAKSFRGLKTLGLEFLDPMQEKIIQDIIHRDQVHLMPVERKEVLGDCKDIALDVPVIIGNTKEFVWDVQDEEVIVVKEEVVKTQETKREELRQMTQRFRTSTIVRQCSNPSKHGALQDIYKKKLLEDPDYMKHYQDMTVSDKAIIKRITLLTITATFLGIISAILSLISFISSIMDNPKGGFLYIWITGFLEVFAVVSIVSLFSLVHTQEKENLRLLSRIGKNKNRINKLYAFVLPDYLKKEKSKRDLEMKINYMTTQHETFFPPKEHEDHKEKRYSL